MDWREKIAYLQGLARGLDVSSQSREGQIVVELLEVVDGMAKEIDELTKTIEDLDEYVSVVDDDLASLEESVAGDQNGSGQSQPEQTTQSQ